MALKEIIKKITPKFLMKILRIIKFKFIFCSTIQQHIKNDDILFIFGNGPSLKEQLEAYSSILSKKTCLCVNSFVLTKYYAIIKPRIYLLIDPFYFMPANDTEIEKESLATLRGLKENTVWNMDIIIPAQDRKNSRIDVLRENSNIRLIYVNLYNCAVYHNNKTKFKLYNKNKLAAPGQTVLNTALYLGIYWRYKTIVMIGADTSWHKMLDVDQETNRLYFMFEHFYGTKKLYIYKDIEQKKPSNMYMELRSIAKVFEYYHILSEYADFNSVAVYNASKMSYLDSFARKHLESFL